MLGQYETIVFHILFEMLSNCTCSLRLSTPKPKFVSSAAVKLYKAKYRLGHPGNYYFYCRKVNLQHDSIRQVFFSFWRIASLMVSDIVLCDVLTRSKHVFVILIFLRHTKKKGQTIPTIFYLVLEIKALVTNKQAHVDLWDFKPSLTRQKNIGRWKNFQDYITWMLDSLTKKIHFWTIMTIYVFWGNAWHFCYALIEFSGWSNWCIE